MRAVDLALRFLFFATIPFLATRVSALFPMTGVIVNIALTLAVFAFAEAVRSRAARSRVLAFLVRRQLAFEAHYRERPPRSFLFYVLFPLLLPVRIFQKDARRELLLYSDFTGTGLVVLIVTGAVDFTRNWQPDLHLVHFLAVWLILFVVQTFCTLLFLVPIATTVVKLHSERRFAALWLLLGIAALSAAIGVVDLERRRAPVVSWVTTERVSLRTRALPAEARSAQLEALRAVWSHPDELAASTDKRGWVEDDALDRAEEQLEAFYRDDEAYAFTLHALPPEAPDVLVLQCHLGGGRPSLWRAVRKSGQEVLSTNELPPGIIGLPRNATRRPPTKVRAPYKRTDK